MASPPRSRISPPALPGDLVEEILLRLPPDEPACLLRASLVCKIWGGIVSHPAFRRRLHEFHRTPPVLGVLHNWYDEEIPRFIPTTASSFSLAAPDRHSWRALDCRHGRAIFLSMGPGANELLVWEPITGAQQRVQVLAAAAFSDYQTAAVFCASDGCDHRGCLGGPFRVVFIFSVFDEDEFTVTSACLYSSETGTWGELTWMRDDQESLVSSDYSSVLIGMSLLYFMTDSRSIYEYDLARHNLALFDLPDYMGRFNLMLAEDGGLGVIQGFNSHLRLWSREASGGSDARWVLSRVICLENLLPNGTTSVNVLGFAEGANAIFASTFGGLFTIELQSERARKVLDEHDDDDSSLIPIVSFYTPHPGLEVLGGKHPAEEMGSEEGGGEEEKTLEQVQELFDKGCKAMELRQCK